MDTPPCFSAILTKENNFYDFLLGFLADRAFLWEHILCLKSRPPLKREAKMKMAELLPHRKLVANFNWEYQPMYMKFAQTKALQFSKQAGACPD